MTPKQAKFTNCYIETGSATEAAMEAYEPKNRATASVIGHENLRKPKIRAFLDEKAVDAVVMIYKLSQKARSENVRLNANRDILDRAGYFVDKSVPTESQRPVIIHVSQVLAEKRGISWNTIECPPNCFKNKTDEELVEIIENSRSTKRDQAT
jgi:phage terminase small subunit